MTSTPRPHRLPPGQRSVILLAGGPSDHPELRGVGSGILRQAERSGLVVVLVPFENSGEALRREFDQMAADGAVGVVAFGHQVTAVELPDGLAHLPRVWIDPRQPRLSWTLIEVDREASAKGVVHTLRGLGHRRIGYVGQRPAQDRPDPWRRPVAEALVLADVFEPEIFLVEGADATGGRRAGRRVLERRDRPTAVICRSGRMAMGLYDAAADLGLSVPGDLSVLALDDSDIAAADLRPPLSALRVPYVGMGSRAVSLLTDQDSLMAPEVLRQRCVLVSRGSVGPAG